MSGPYSLGEFVEDLRNIATKSLDDPAILESLTPLAQRLAVSPDLRGRCRGEINPDQGFGFDVLHEETDHALAVALLRWLPGRGTLPHNHGTWEIVVGVEGSETNIFWRRLDDGSKAGYAKLAQLSERAFYPGEAVVLLPDDIHSVVNSWANISVSLHVYGKNVYYTKRSHFDVKNNSELPWVVKQT